MKAPGDFDPVREVFSEGLIEIVVHVSVDSEVGEPEPRVHHDVDFAFTEPTTGHFQPEWILLAHI